VLLSEKIQLNSRTMNIEDAQRTHNHEEEVRGLNIDIGNEET
jgi:hypothetical protein